MKNILLILILFNALVWFGCNNKNGIKDSGTSKLNKVEDSLEDRKRNLDQKFENEKLANEKKYDSLKIKADSTKNKSNLSGFLENTPIYNKMK